MARSKRAWRAPKVPRREMAEKSFFCPYCVKQIKADLIRGSEHSKRCKAIRDKQVAERAREEAALRQAAEELRTAGKTSTGSGGSTPAGPSSPNIKK
ncbi:Os09g0340500 [Oryza sativa Japonica Group]|uniref:Os09g0340500 protein n=3 Tax=Oryza sativa subsp. japonica TaxID=39947 RepID=A3BXQ1_ORYSJ|nr:hypothetical protein OsJ_28965 [Oryza sativa Japonica Group]BAT07577.1 Os09g0340500 [Oryza sativa Japonica Group]